MTANVTLQIMHDREGFFWRLKLRQLAPSDRVPQAPPSPRGLYIGRDTRVKSARAAEASGRRTARTLGLTVVSTVSDPVGV